MTNGSAGPWSRLDKCSSRSPQHMSQSFYLSKVSLVPHPSPFSACILYFCHLFLSSFSTLSWHIRRSTNQIWASHDSINVDNLRDLLMIDVMVTFDNPHSSVGIRLITNMSEPTNKGTVIVLAMILECKEDADLSNINAQHPPLVWVCLNEDGVVSESTFLPWWCSMNTFASHTFSAAHVTRCIEMSNGWVVYWDFAGKDRQNRFREIGDVGVGIQGVSGRESSSNELVDKKREVRTMDIMSNEIRVCMINWEIALISKLTWFIEWYSPTVLARTTSAKT